MSYIRKTKDVWDLVTDYGYGKEVECTYADRNEAVADCQTYIDEKKKGFLSDLRTVYIVKRREAV